MVQCYLIYPFNVWWPCSNISLFNVRFFFASFHFSHSIYGHGSAQRSLMPCTARFSGPGWKPRSSAQRRGYSWLRLTAAKMWRRGLSARALGTWGPKNGAKWTDWKTRSDLGEEILGTWEMPFFMGIFFDRMEIHGRCQGEDGQWLSPYGWFFALKTMSWWVVPYHIPSHQYERPDGHYCLPLSKKKTYNPSYPTKRGYSTQLYPIYIYIPIYYYWYPTISRSYPPIISVGFMPHEQRQQRPIRCQTVGRNWWRKHQSIHIYIYIIYTYIIIYHHISIPTIPSLKDFSYLDPPST